MTPRFERWLRTVSPKWNWTWRHLVYTQQHLDRLTRGEIDRLMIFEPPRHGKTELVTVRYPVWRLERDPDMSVIVAAYNQERANTVSRKARRIARQRELLSDERLAVQEWHTRGGGLYRAVGVGAGITGVGGDLIVIDDPIKSREEADSLVYRERVWDWFTDDLYTRLEPGGAMVLICTRWHEDDLAGRILSNGAGGDWSVLTLPALAEADDPLGRVPGAALCRARFDVDALERIRETIGSWSFAALYQQRPLPLEGALAHRSWFDVVDQVPTAQYRVRAWDLAATEKKLATDDPDWTVGTLIAKANGRYYIEDVVRARVGPGGVDELIRTTAQQDSYAVWVRLPQDPGAAGKLALNAQVKALAGYVVRSGTVSGDKVTRAMPFLAQAEHGNVSLVRGSWNRAWLEEICSFPVGAHDDQVDSAADAFNELANVLPPLVPAILHRGRVGR